MDYRRYTLSLLAIFLVVLTVVPLLNWLVDPFWYFRIIDVPGFNRVKPAYHVYEREVKSALVSKLRPQAIILGSSFAEVGFPVTDPDFTEHGKLSAYNLAVPWSQGAELYCYALFALNQPGVKRVVLGGFSTAAESCAKYANLGKPDYRELLLSKTAFVATLNTLRGQGEDQSSTADGMWSYLRNLDSFHDDNDIMGGFANAFAGSLCPSPQQDHALNPNLIDRSVPRDDASTAGLRNIIRLALRKHVQLILVDFPKHVLYYEQSRACGRTEAYLSELWKIASIVQQEAGPDSTQVQFWTFYGYGAINGEPVRAGIPMSQRLWQDYGHFNPPVGHAAFASIFAASRAFGHRVTTRDFDAIIADGEAQRKVFLRDHSWVQQELDELRRKAALLKGPRPALP